jgi:hypothetical protein
VSPFDERRSNPCEVALQVQRWPLMTTTPPKLLPLRGERDVRNRTAVNFTRLDLVSKHSKCECASHLRGFLRRVAVDQDAGELGDLRDPPAVSFLFELDRQGHRVSENYDMDSRHVPARKSTPIDDEQRGA